jgi:hypothetical protein
MARIQVMPLPTRSVGEHTSTPFVIVIDQVHDMTMAAIDQLNSESAVLIKQTGASALWVFADGDLDVAQPLDLDDETKQHLMRALHQAPSGQHTSPI